MEDEEREMPDIKLREKIARKVAERQPDDAPWEELNQYKQMTALATASEILTLIKEDGYMRLAEWEELHNQLEKLRGMK